MTESRNGVAASTRLTATRGRVRRRAVLAMVEGISGFKRVTLERTDYGAREFVRELRDFRLLPMTAQKPTSAIDRFSRQAFRLTAKLVAPYAYDSRPAARG